MNCDYILECDECPDKYFCPTGRSQMMPMSRREKREELLEEYAYGTGYYGIVEYPELFFDY